ncbi:hypothetical protein [Aureimonas sp. AU4]|uniref:hypothetical protein n=1 Tax=Aureimonas sp. AU4 TaxID=1638163 RepID=UPI000A59FDB1|nr:hypothetical protein [Aureimonas sp. AU4]
MTSPEPHPSAAKGDAKGTPFGFVSLQDRKPSAVPPIRCEIRDLLAQRGKG